LNDRIENKVLEAFDKIHELGVVHNDVRADNILVSLRDDDVWVVDFECASDGNEESFQSEQNVVRRLMTKVKEGRD